jgi:hypothetical protein
MDTIFLETSAQIVRLSGTRSGDKVNKIISDEIDKNSNFITSTIVFREFLNTLIKDILYVRDLVRDEFLAKNIFIINLAEITEKISERRLNSSASKRIYLIIASLQRRFDSNSKVNVRKIIRFLNNNARNKVFYEFKQIANESEIIDCGDKRYKFLGQVKCLNDHPMQTECTLKNGKKCLCLLDTNRNGSKPCGENGCLDLRKPTTKCFKRGKRVESCKINKLIEKEENTLKDIIYAVKNNKINRKYISKEKNNKLEKVFLEVCDNGRINASKVMKISVCAWYLTDIFIFLQCKKIDAIISKDKDFEELSSVTGKPINRVWIQD